MLITHSIYLFMKFLLMILLNIDARKHKSSRTQLWTILYHQLTLPCANHQVTLPPGDTHIITFLTNQTFAQRFDACKDGLLFTFQLLSWDGMVA